jgi:tryptophan halogenase
VLASLGYAYHFDASRYAAFLRRLAEANGVVRVEGRIGHVPLDPEPGIAAVELVDGRRVEGELFIDCSGFRSLLLGEALVCPIAIGALAAVRSRVIAVPAAPGPACPIPDRRRDSAGWRWRIPLQHRVGNGYVFSSAFLEEEEAQRRLWTAPSGRSAHHPLRRWPARNDVAGQLPGDRPGRLYRAAGVDEHPSHPVGEHFA